MQEQNWKKLQNFDCINYNCKYWKFFFKISLKKSIEDIKKHEKKSWTYGNWIKKR